MKHVTAVISCLFCSVLYGTPVSAQESLVLVANGEVQSVIVLPDVIHPPEELAATEIQLYLQKITGGTITIGNSTDDGQAEIHIGRTDGFYSSTALQKLQKLEKEEGFVIQREDQRIFICGLSPLGTLYGAYRFLEELGVRWFMPTELGEVVPNQESISIDHLSIRKEPDYTVRWIGKGNDWSRRNRQNVNINVNGTRPGVNIWKTFHTFHTILNSEIYFDDHPEWFPLRNGVRIKYNNSGGNTTSYQLSLEGSWQKVAERLIEIYQDDPELDILTLGPNDGVNSGWSEEEAETSLDEPGVDYYRKYSRRLYIFYNRVARELQQAIPHVQLKVGTYNTFMGPPLDQSIIPEENVWLFMTHQNFCHAHPLFEGGDCPNAEFMMYMDEWRERTDRMYIYEYYYKGYWRGAIWPIWRSIAADIPYYFEKGVTGLYTQYSNNNYFGLLLNNYVAARFQWDTNTDIDSLLTDYYDKFFMSAAGPMRNWYETFETALTGSGKHISGVAEQAVDIYTPALFDEARQYLSDAYSAESHPDVTARIRKAEYHQEYTEMLMEFYRRRNDVLDYSGTREGLYVMYLRYKQTEENLLNYVDTKKQIFTDIMFMDKRRIEQDITAFNRKFNPSTLEHLVSTAVDQPFPNPFIPDEAATLVIPFFTVDWQDATGKVINLQGTCVRQLSAPQFHEDRFAFFWDGRDDNGDFVPSGIYILLLHSNEMTEKRKIAVVR